MVNQLYVIYSQAMNLTRDTIKFMLLKHLNRYGYNGNAL